MQPLRRSDHKARRARQRRVSRARSWCRAHGAVRFRVGTRTLRRSRFALSRLVRGAPRSCDRDVESTTRRRRAGGRGPARRVATRTPGRFALTVSAWPDCASQPFAEGSRALAAACCRRRSQRCLRAIFPGSIAAGAGACRRGADAIRRGGSARPTPAQRAVRSLASAHPPGTLGGRGAATERISAAAQQPARAAGRVQIHPDGSEGGSRQRAALQPAAAARERSAVHGADFARGRRLETGDAAGPFRGGHRWRRERRSAAARWPRPAQRGLIAQRRSLRSAGVPSSCGFHGRRVRRMG